MDDPERTGQRAGGGGRGELSLVAVSAAQELNGSLGVLHGLLKQLVELADQKLAGMRSADAAALQTCAARELEVLQRVAATEQQRKAILARLAQALQIPAGGAACLAETVARVPEPFSSALRARKRALHEIARQLERKNKLAAGVAHNLQAHLRAVFAEVAKANQESVVYGPKGQHEQAGVRSWLDAVG